MVPTPSPIEVVEEFNARINEGDVVGLSGLMDDDYTFIDIAGTVEVGRQQGMESWAGFFRQFPDYRNHFETINERDNLVVVSGYSECSFEELSGPALWSATVRDGRIALWRVHEDTPENRSVLGVG